MARILPFVPKFYTTPTFMCGLENGAPFHVWPPKAAVGAFCRCGGLRLHEHTSEQLQRFAAAADAS